MEDVIVGDLSERARTLIYNSVNIINKSHEVSLQFGHHHTHEGFGFFVSVTNNDRKRVTFTKNFEGRAKELLCTVGNADTGDIYSQVELDEDDLTPTKLVGYLETELLFLT